MNYPGQKTVYALLPSEFHSEGWMPVGRLDKDSTGLLLFVKEGFLVGRLQRPGNLEKIYDVWVRGHVQPPHVEKILEGVESPVGILKAKSVEILGGAGPKTHLRMVLTEGKNRHIRRLFWLLTDLKFKRRLKVLELKRIKIGSLNLSVPSGQWRFLTEEETETLLRCIPPKKTKTL